MGSPSSWLVICEGHDADAIWAGSALRRRGHRVELVSSESLASARRFEQHLDGDPDGGADAFRVVLDDGRELDLEQVQGVLNRAWTFPQGHLVGVAPADLDYARQELHAFYLGWLAGLPGPVLNPATPRGFAGAWRSAFDWAVLASRAGLGTAPLAVHSSLGPPAQGMPPAWTPPGAQRLQVVGERLLGPPLPEDVAESVRRLARLSCTPLLELTLLPPGVPPWHSTEWSHGWTFVDARPHVELRWAGEAMIDALAEALADGDGPGQRAGTPEESP
ncbi:MAG: hypothetical protein MI919_32845 [Holophagales bacterium]|nr:hypothetical protein [Holophagales bacterium]